MTDRINETASLIMVVLGKAKEIISIIDKQESHIKCKIPAIVNLEGSVGTLKEDMNNHHLFLKTMFAKDVNVRAREKLCIELNGREALNNLEVSLRAAQLLLELNQVADFTSPESNVSKVDPVKRPPIAQLLSSFFRANSLSDDETLSNISSTVLDIEVCRGNCNRSFKCVWNLYLIYQQPKIQQVSTSSDHSGGVEGALHNVEMAFYKRPFAVSAEGEVRVTFTNLTILNRTSENSTRHMELMRDIGRRWVQCGMDHNDFMGRPGKATSRIQALGRLQTTLFELLWSGTIEQMKRPGSIDILAQEKSEFKVELYELETALQEAIVRAKRERFAIAFCGMVKAGKSLFLNALIGKPILPSDELPSTAWPCRLRHVPGQTTPMFTYDKAPFISGLEALQKVKYGYRLKTYRPPSDDIFDMMLYDAEIRLPTDEDSKLKELYSSWVDLHAATKRNLDEFEDPRYVLPESAEGYEDVKRLLGTLNDIIRLCFRFKLAFKMDDVEWPLLTLEFTSLCEHQMDGIYEFIDLPGIEEQFETFSFDNMVRLVAKDSNAIVPIISFKELARKDWKRLPEVVSNGFSGRANIVVCTHLDQIHGENRTEQLSIVSKVFWPGNVQQAAASNIISCSSVMGLSARALLDLSPGGLKPTFSSFWDSNRKKVTHLCAEKILGVGQPEQNFDSMSPALWKTKLISEMDTSGLPAAIKKLTREIVDQAKQRTLIQECEAVCKQLRKMSTAQERKLLEARRTKREFDAAKKEFEDARAKFFSLINSWTVNKLTQEQAYKIKLDKGIKALSQRAESFIPTAIEQTLAEWSLGLIKQATDVELSRAPENAKAQQQGETTVLIVTSVAHAEEFLRLSQIALKKLLNDLKQDFVIVVRKMAEDARAKRFQELKDEINRLDPRIQPELRGEIIEDLGNQSVNIRQVAFSQIKSKIKMTKTRHTARTAARAMEQQIAKPLLANKENSESPLDVKGKQHAQQAVEDLGFVSLRPVEAKGTQSSKIPRASISSWFGSPAWPWITHSQAFHLGMDVVGNRYREEIIKPWIKDLATASEKSLAGTITTSSQIARTAVENALAREDGRYKRESDERNQNRSGMVPNMVALNSSIWAAESALRAIQQELIKSLKDEENNVLFDRRTKVQEQLTAKPPLAARRTRGESSNASSMQ